MWVRDAPQDQGRSQLLGFACRDPLNPIRIRGKANNGKMSVSIGFRALATTFCRTRCRTLPEFTATVTATVLPYPFGRINSRNGG